MHYNESTDEMNKEKKISKTKDTYILNSLAFTINACVIITMGIYFVMKESLLSKPIVVETPKE